MRELLSNAADAIERRRFLALTSDRADGATPRVRVWRDGDVLNVQDTGAGMTRREMAQGLGTIGASGATKFAEAISALSATVASADAKASCELSTRGRCAASRS